LHINRVSRHQAAEVGDERRVLIDVAKIEMVLCCGLVIEPAHLFLIQIDVGNAARYLGDFNCLRGVSIGNVDGGRRAEGGWVSRLVSEGTLVHQLFSPWISRKRALQLGEAGRIGKECTGTGIAGGALEGAHPIRAAEEEKLVLDDGTAQGTAISVLSEGWDGGPGAAGGGILSSNTVAKLRSLLPLGKRRQPGPAVELKARSMELIRSTFGDVVDDASCVASVLRAEVVGDHLDLLQRILVGEIDLTAR